jgi:hypothetical protein
MFAWIDEMKGRKTGGRKKGVKNKSTVLKELAEQQALADAAASAEASPLEFLVNVFRNPTVAPALRLSAARDAAQYVHGKPASRPEPEQNVQIIDGTCRVDWTMTDYQRLIELEALAARGRFHNKEELAALTERMPCSHEEGEQADVLGINNPLKPATPAEIERINLELGILPNEPPDD